MSNGNYCAHTIVLVHRMPYSSNVILCKS